MLSIIISKKPISYRLLGILISVAILLLSVPCFLSASETLSSSTLLLTVQEAVHRGLSQPAVKQRIEGRIGVAQSQVTQTALWPNPQLWVQREAANPSGRGENIDEYVWLAQKIDFSGRRGLRVDAAKQRVQATQLKTKFWRLGLKIEIRQRFYQVLYRQELRQTLGQWSERLEVIKAVIRRREAGGVISGYDRLRLTREQAAVRTRLQSAKAAYRRVWEYLLGILGKREDDRIYRGVAGSLLPGTPPQLKQLLQILTQRPDLRSLEQQIDATAFERRAAARGWIPNVTLNLGTKKAITPSGSGVGSYIVAGINLPFFDRDQAERDRATAKAQRALGEYQLTLRDAQGAVRGRWQELRQLVEVAQEVRHQDMAATRELVRTAKVAYESGEIGILELLDAYRQEADTLIRALQLEQRARQAHIELERLTGGFS
jgi:cobalt-zinc-cadmium efflux system outer membrane protein